MASANKKNKNLATAGLASAAIHGLILALGCLNIFEPQINNDMFLNVELAGAAELQQALDDYDKRPIIEEQPSEIEQKLPESEVIQTKETEQKQPVNEPLPESQLQQEEAHEEQLVEGPSIVEPSPELEEPKPGPESDPEPEPEPEEGSEQESENALPPELQNEKTLRLEKEKLEQEKIKKEKQERHQREQEEKRRLEKEKRKKLRDEKLKKKKEAARRRKKRLEAIKRIEKKNKAKKKRLAKIADVIKKNDEARKKEQQKKNSAFDQMLKKEKKNLGRSLSGKGSGSGNGNGLGSYGDGMGITDSDATIISSQIIPHWVVAGGVKNAETLIIRIKIKVKDNGEVPASSIEIIDRARYNSDSVFKSAADSAKRAILQASPLKIPPEKMHLFRNFEFSFNTDKALGVRR